MSKSESETTQSGNTDVVVSLKSLFVQLEGKGICVCIAVVLLTVYKKADKFIAYTSQYNYIGYYTIPGYAVRDFFFMCVLL